MPGPEAIRPCSGRRTRTWPSRCPRAMRCCPVREAVRRTARSAARWPWSSLVARRISANPALPACAPTSGAGASRPLPSVPCPSATACSCCLPRCSAGRQPSGVALPSGHSPWRPPRLLNAIKREPPRHGLVTVGIGLVGCGRWGLNYLRVFSELEGCEVVGACDSNPVRCTEAERRLPGLKTTPKVSQLVADSAVDAVVVATDATRHYDVALAALQAGKDCLVEKPITTSVDQARRLAGLATSRHLLLMVGHVFRYNPGINHLQKLIGSGTLGQLEYLTFTRTNLGPIRSDVNVVWDLMTHDVSILLHFLNQRPTWVSAQGACFLSAKVEDVAFATLGFEGGVIANIRASWLDPRKVREITVVGSGKMAFFNDLETQEPVRIFDKGALREPSYETFGEFKLVTRSGEVVSPAIPASEPLKNQCQHFMRALTTRQPVLSDGADGLRVVEVVVAINQSIAQRGAPVVLRDALAEAA